MPFASSSTSFSSSSVLASLALTLALASESFPEPGLPALSPLPASRPDLRADASLPLPSLPFEPLSPFLPLSEPFFFSSSPPSALPEELRSSSAAAARIASYASEKWRNGGGFRSANTLGDSSGAHAWRGRGRKAAGGATDGTRDRRQKRLRRDPVEKERTLAVTCVSGTGRVPDQGWRRSSPRPSSRRGLVWSYSLRPQPWPRCVRAPIPRPWKRAPSPREIRVFLLRFARFTAESLSGLCDRAPSAQR